MDPHLTAKGAVTTTVAVTGGALGALATVFGAPMLLAALGVGVTGLGVQFGLDANTDGVCLTCRAEQHDVAEDSEAKVDQEESESSIILAACYVLYFLGL